MRPCQRRFAESRANAAPGLPVAFSVFVNNPDPRASQSAPTGRGEFYNEQKWCEHCRQYVSFLMSVNYSYCVTCGGRVRLFSRDDADRFQQNVQRHKWQAS